jgi:hypothetical protein
MQKSHPSRCLLLAMGQLESDFKSCTAHHRCVLCAAHNRHIQQWFARFPRKYTERSDLLYMP